MYLDTAILVKLLVREPDSDFYAALVDGQIVWSSHVIVTEAFSALLRKQREGAITSAHRRKAWKQMEDDLAGGRLNLVTLGSEIFTRANEILDGCHPAIALRALDAIHVASAEQCRSWPVCSNDGRMRAACERFGIPLAPIPGPSRRT